MYRDSCKCYSITLENFQKLPAQAVQAAKLMAVAEGAAPPSAPEPRLDHIEQEILSVRPPPSRFSPAARYTAMHAQPPMPVPSASRRELQTMRWSTCPIWIRLVSSLHLHETLWSTRIMMLAPLDWMIYSVAVTTAMVLRPRASRAGCESAL